MTSTPFCPPGRDLKRSLVGRFSLMKQPNRHAAVIGHSHAWVLPMKRFYFHVTMAGGSTLTQRVLNSTVLRLFGNTRSRMPGTC